MRNFKTVVFGVCLIVSTCLYSGCSTYTGFWDELWERLGFPGQEQTEENQSQREDNDGGQVKEETKEPGEDAAGILTEIERDIFNQINEYRISRGLNSLALDSRIVEQARKHSRNMGNGVVPFSHQGFRERVNATGIAYRSAAENVAYNYNYPDPAGATVDGWLASEGHRRNIEGNFDLTGVGVVQNDEGYYYYTQIFLLGR